MAEVLDAAWIARARRARLLADAVPAAAAMLRFYAELASTQSALLRTHGRALRDGDTFEASLDPSGAQHAFDDLLATLTRQAPVPIADASVRLLRQTADVRRAAVDAYWRARTADGDVEAFLAEATLQPFAEAIARRMRATGVAPDAPDAPADAEAAVEGGGPPARCPVCGDPPLVALLREQGHGARRSYVCGFCLTEWGAPRLLCPCCGETRFGALPVFRARQVPGVRIDGCDTCRAYLKTLDLTRDGTLLPVVDDIATPALDLWAREQAYQRPRPGLLRV